MTHSSVKRGIKISFFFSLSRTQEEEGVQQSKRSPLFLLFGPNISSIFTSFWWSHGFSDVDGRRREIQIFKFLKTIAPVFKNSKFQKVMTLQNVLVFSRHIINQKK
jgi:hypothetical protein